ncbi:hypothetical protein PSSHI_24290 [Photobacterium sp. R1]
MASSPVLFDVGENQTISGGESVSCQDADGEVYLQFAKLLTRKAPKGVPIKWEICYIPAPCTYKNTTEST